MLSRYLPASHNAMKNLILFLFTALVLSCSASVFAQAKTSLEYMQEGNVHFINGDFKLAIPPYEKALELEKNKRRLKRDVWIALVEKLGTAHANTRDFKSAFAVLEYGTTVEPTHPVFYYNIACGHGELGDEDNAIKYLRLAYKNKANMPPGKRFPDPMRDTPFENFADSEKFKTAVAEMKNGQ